MQQDQANKLADTIKRTINLLKDLSGFSFDLTYKAYGYEEALKMHNSLKRRARLILGEVENAEKDS